MEPTAEPTVEPIVEPVAREEPRVNFQNEVYLIGCIAFPVAGIFLLLKVVLCTN